MIVALTHYALHSRHPNVNSLSRRKGGAYFSCIPVRVRTCLLVATPHLPPPPITIHPWTIRRPRSSLDDTGCPTVTLIPVRSRSAFVVKIYIYFETMEEDQQ